MLENLKNLIELRAFLWVSLALGAAFGVLGYYQMERVEAILTAVERAEIESRTISANLVEGAFMRERRGDLRDLSAQIAANLIYERELAENMEYFYEIESLAGVTISELRQLNSRQGVAFGGVDPHFLRIPFRVGVSGSYIRLMEFLHRVENGPRYASITGFTFQRAGETSNDLALQVQLELLGLP